MRLLPMILVYPALSQTSLKKSLSLLNLSGAACWQRRLEFFRKIYFAFRLSVTPSYYHRQYIVTIYSVHSLQCNNTIYYGKKHWEKGGAVQDSILTSMEWVQILLFQFTGFMASVNEQHCIWTASPRYFLLLQSSCKSIAQQQAFSHYWNDLPPLPLVSWNTSSSSGDSHGELVPQGSENT